MKRTTALATLIITLTLVLAALVGFNTAPANAVTPDAPASYGSFIVLSNTPIPTTTALTTSARNWSYYDRADFYIVSATPITVAVSHSADAVTWFDSVTMIYGATSSSIPVTVTRGIFYKLTITPPANNASVFTPTIRVVMR